MELGCVLSHRQTRQAVFLQRPSRAQGTWERNRVAGRIVGIGRERMYPVRTRAAVAQGTASLSMPEPGAEREVCSPKRYGATSGEVCVPKPDEPRGHTNVLRGAG